MNVKRILVPLDYSDNANDALNFAVSLAREYEAELHVVHVYEQPLAYAEAGIVGAPPIVEVPESDVLAARANLDSVDLPDDIEPKLEFLIGSPIFELVNYAKENHIDLVVMGTHGRTGLHRLIMGSVAEGMVRRSPCPVLTIKPPTPVLQQTA